MKPTVSYGIMTSARLLERAKAVKDTWGKDVEYLYFLGGREQESSLPIVNLGEQVGETWESAFDKQFLGLEYMYKHNPNSEWYYLAGCDTFVHTQNTSDMLKRFDPQSDCLLGGHAGNFIPLYKKKSFPVQKFPSGGAGFFISNKLMSKLAGKANEILTEWPAVFQNEFEPGTPNIPDVAIVYYTWKYFGVLLTEVEGFYGFPPEKYKSIIERPLTFHYISPAQMHKLYNDFKSA